MSSIVLGVKEGGNFIINENAHNILKEMVVELENDKKGTYRLALVNDRVLHDQIIPCLVAAKDSNVIPITIVRLLSKMTDPFATMFANNQNRSLSETYHSYLSIIKERFNDPLVTWAILKLLKSLTAINPSPTDKNGSSLKDCLTLLTNLFSIPEFQPSSSPAAVIAYLQRPSRQNGLIWNLLYQSFDSILLDLIHLRLWSEPVVEIIRLMFKDTKAEIMQKLIKEWMDSASNTSSDYTYPWSSDEDEAFTSDQTNSDPEFMSKKSKKKSHVSCSPDCRIAHPAEPFDPQAEGSGTVTEQDLENRMKMECEPSKPCITSGSASPPNTDQRRSSSSMSDHSTTEFRDLREGNKRKVQDILANLTSGISTSNEPAPKKRKLSGERDIAQRKRLLSRAERRKYQKDGFSSGITGSENASSDSESEEEKWRVKAGDFSDPGYYSYQNQLATAKRKLEINSQDEIRNRRKKLLEVRAKTKKLKPRTLVVYQVSTEEDMLEVLREFAVDFLLKGYAILLTDIHQHLLKSKECLDLNLKYKKNYAWLIYYFLPLASQIEISIQQIALTYDVMHYLTGETIFCILKILSTSFEVCNNEFEVIKEFVKAQRHFFETLSKYEKTQMTKMDSFQHKLTLLQVVHTKNIRQQFILLIRLSSLCGRPPFEYLSNLIAVNHIHLTTIQETLSNPSDVEFDMSSHIKQFSTVDMMRPFGQLLENFRENSVTVNDCIFTMMHHVAGDLNCPQALDVRPIPETLQQLNVTEMQVCDDWKDLIEYMINYFRFRKRNFKDNSKSSISSHSSTIDKGNQTYSIKSDCSKSENEEASPEKEQSFQGIKLSSPENKASSTEHKEISTEIKVNSLQIKESFSENKNISPESSKNPPKNNPSEESSRKVEHAVHDRKYATKSKDKATREKDTALAKLSSTNGTIGNNETGRDGKDDAGNDGKNEAGVASPAFDAESARSASMIAFPSPSQSCNSSPTRSSANNASLVWKAVVRSLVEILRRNGEESAVTWLQESLLDAWKVRLTPVTANHLVATSCNNQLPLEPLPCYHIHRGMDIPLVAWSVEHSSSLKNKVFLQLLSQMGFHVGDNPTRNFPTIPRSWTANDLLDLAMNLGSPVNEKQYPELLGTEYATKLVQCVMMPSQIW